MKQFRAVDLFCGGGGTSTGLLQACAALGMDPAGIDLTAVNHWQVAISTHAANHPGARHIDKRIEQIQPEKVVPGGRADLLWASPECIHHSVARGGRPRDDQSRAQAWTVLDWVQRLQPSVVCIENVPEFASWGPLYASGRAQGKPIPGMKGQTFAAWKAALASLNYRVDHTILNCADYGDATTRRRFFLVARRGNRRITWPSATHAEVAGADLFGSDRQPWRTARDVIDWSIPGHSIFLTQEQAKAAGLRVKRPLAENTLRRIRAGIERYWGERAEPFLLTLTHGGRIRGLDQPLPTVTGANRGEIGLVEPFMVEYYGEGQFTRVAAPIPTVTTKARFGLVRPFIVPQFGERGGQTPRTHDIDAPLPAVTGHGAGALVEPLILGQDSRGIMRPVSQPVPAVAGAGAHAVVRPFIHELDGQRYLIDILFRMLTPAELAAAHSFPSDYTWSGTSGQIIKQIGNSVPVSTAQAICQAAAGEALRAA